MVFKYLCTRLYTDPTLSRASILYGRLVQNVNIGLRFNVNINMDNTSAPVLHTILGYRASGT